MKSNEALRIYDYISSKDRAGVSYLQISAETKIEASRVNKYLNQFSKTFVRVGCGSKFTINRFVADKKPRETLVSQIAAHNQEKILSLFGIAMFCLGVAIFISVGSFNGL